MTRSVSLCLFVAVIFALFAAAQENAQTPAAPDPYKPTLDHLESLTELPLADWRIHSDVSHPEDPAVDDSSWEVVQIGSKWTGARVLRRWIEIPEMLNGYAVQGAHVKLDLRFDFPWNNLGPVAISIFSNAAVLYHGDDDMQQPLLLTENAQPHQKFLIAARVVAGNVETDFDHAQLLIESPASRPGPLRLRTEINAARPMIEAYKDGKAERERTLDAAMKAIDFSLLEKGDQAGFDASLRLAQSKLQTLDPWLKQFTIRAIGNSHIDMAWLWPWTETVEVVRNTFQSVLDLMREYPDLKFTMSSARTYEWMQEKYPDLCQQIKERVKEGRWEVIGGMWVEPDLNMPAGESLVRQILVGKRYFQKNFGIDIKIGWNPDSFGYNWQLPQIYKKSGIDYFVTSKLL
jgi:alpha-mannosidase